jgi:lipopolysaccharide/colanic/teichoic acid biosynthesis glycosyltransferase
MSSVPNAASRPVPGARALPGMRRGGRNLVLVSAETHPAVAVGAHCRLRRLLNVAVAVIGLVLAAPLMVIIGILIKFTSRGPVLYRQTRVGVDRRSGNGGNWRRRLDYGGRLFTIYKFRTMYVDGSRPQVWARPDDPRVTPLGRVLRKYRLDELPQLVNVLKGDMNVVGPRPEQPQIFLQLREKVARYQDRQRVLPGITGWAQVNQAYDQNIDDVRRKVEFDLEYAGRVSAAEDVKILLRTVPVVLFRKGGW